MISGIKVRVVIILFFVFSSLWLFGQNGTKFEVIQPSPNASAIGRFGDVPVSLSTGIPQISVPIYSYSGTSNGLRLNVSLDYHAGGLKVSEVASNVGLNWSLSAGGVISRTIYGIADFGITSNGFNTADTLPNGPGQINRIKGCLQWASPGSPASLSSNTPCNGQAGCLEKEADFSKIVSIYKGVKDGQFDLFNYSFGGYSGKFIIGKNDSILQIPQTNLRITRIPGIGFLGFTITTPEGVQYKFNEREFNNYGVKTCGLPAFSTCDVTSTNQDVSSWYLTKVYSQSNSDSITLIYQGAVPRYDLDIGETYYEGLTGNPPVHEKTTAYNGEIGGNIPNEQRISSIQLPDKTYINFEYDNSTTRNDIRANGKALRKIQISNGSSSYEYQLYQSYFSTSGKKLIPVPTQWMITIIG